MKQTVLLLSVISAASAGDCSQYKTETTCLGCEDVSGTCTQIVNPCDTTSETECTAAADCHWMAGTGSCMTNLGVVDACNGAMDCLNCEWNGGECKAPEVTCSQYKTEATCLGCEDVSGTCTQIVNPCDTTSETECTAAADCHWMAGTGSCMTNLGVVDACNGAMNCLNCKWNGGECKLSASPPTPSPPTPSPASPPTPSPPTPSPASPSTPSPNITPGTCARNGKDSCLSCHAMSAGVCMSNSDSCNGMESHCSSMPNCEMKNNVCTYKVDPCAAATFCGDCYWDNGECKLSDGTQTAAPVDHSMHMSSSGQMVMTFFDSHKVVILWNEIDIDDKGPYALAIIISFILPIFVMVLRDFITRRSEMHLALRMGLMLIVFTLSNLVMLIVMIMNVGLFVAIMIGSTVGFGIVEYLKMKQAEEESNEWYMTQQT